ncbi:hypothetical protein EMCRGX_G011842 [Ephydatia muelleri]
MRGACRSLLQGQLHQPICSIHPRWQGSLHGDQENAGQYQGSKARLSYRWCPKPPSPTGYSLGSRRKPKLTEGNQEAACRAEANPVSNR